MVAEKPSLAQSIAKILSRGRGGGPGAGGSALRARPECGDGCELPEASAGVAVSAGRVRNTPGSGLGLSWGRSLLGTVASDRFMRERDVPSRSDSFCGLMPV